MGRRSRTGLTPVEVTQVLLVFGGIFLLLGTFLGTIAIIRDLPLLHYQTGRCTITGKQLVSVESEYYEQVSSGVGISVPTTTYKPDFDYVVQTADGRRYPAHGYDFLSSSSDYWTEQAVLDRYTVGQTYPCWYDPGDPPHAVLERFYAWDLMEVVFFLGGLIPVLIGGIRWRSQRRRWSGTRRK